VILETHKPDIEAVVDREESLVLMAPLLLPAAVLTFLGTRLMPGLFPE